MRFCSRVVLFVPYSLLTQNCQMSMAFWTVILMKPVVHFFGYFSRIKWRVVPRVLIFFRGVFGAILLVVGGGRLVGVVGRCCYGF